MTIDLNTLHLDTGSHDTRTEGVCLLEAVAWIAGEPHTDHPACVSPVLGVFGRSLNDVLPDDKRQFLIPLITRLPGTAGDGFDEKRGYLALDWMIRVYTPTWLDVAGLADAAVCLRELPAVVDFRSAEVADVKVRRAREEARAAAWDAAGYVAGTAAWDAAGYAAGAAAWDAARYAAQAAARDALKPTVTTLQDSAINLFENMINPT